MKIGLEIECIINRDKLNFPIGDYHNGHKLGKYWESQRDGSLDGDDIFKYEKTVELVSFPIKGKTEFKRAIQELKQILKIKKSGKLSEKVYFNNSCGCHIHVSFNKYKFIRSSHPMILVRTRKFFLKNLFKSNLSKKLKDNIAKQYDRSFAKVYPVERMRNVGRESEFNYGSERNNKGMEWRSFNLCGVTNYKELRRLLNLAYRSLRYLEKQIAYWQDSETNEITTEYTPGTKQNEKVDIILKKKQKQNTVKIKLNKYKPGLETWNISKKCVI